MGDNIKNGSLDLSKLVQGDDKLTTKINEAVSDLIKLGEAISKVNQQGSVNVKVKTSKDDIEKLNKALDTTTANAEEAKKKLADLQSKPTKTNKPTNVDYLMDEKEWLEKVNKTYETYLTQKSKYENGKIKSNGSVKSAETELAKLMNAGGAMQYDTSDILDDIKKIAKDRDEFLRGGNNGSSNWLFYTEETFKAIAEERKKAFDGNSDDIKSTVDNMKKATDAAKKENEEITYLNASLEQCVEMAQKLHAAGGWSSHNDEAKYKEMLSYLQAYIDKGGKVEELNQKLQNLYKVSQKTTLGRSIATSVDKEFGIDRSVEQNEKEKESADKAKESEKEKHDEQVKVVTPDNSVQKQNEKDAESAEKAKKTQNEYKKTQQISDSSQKDDDSLNSLIRKYKDIDQLYEELNTRTKEAAMRSLSKWQAVGDDDYQIIINNLNETIAKAESLKSAFKSTPFSEDEKKYLSSHGYISQLDNIIQLATEDITHFSTELNKVLLSKERASERNNLIDQLKKAYPDVKSYYTEFESYINAVEDGAMKAQEAFDKIQQDRTSDSIDSNVKQNIEETAQISVDSAQKQKESQNEVQEEVKETISYIDNLRKSYNELLMAYEKIPKRQIEQPNPYVYDIGDAKRYVNFDYDGEDTGEKWLTSIQDAIKKTIKQIKDMQDAVKKHGGILGDEKYDDRDIERATNGLKALFELYQENGGNLDEIPIKMTKPFKALIPEVQKTTEELKQQQSLYDAETKSILENNLEQLKSFDELSNTVAHLLEQYKTKKNVFSDSHMPSISLGISDDEFSDLSPSFLLSFEQMCDLLGIEIPQAADKAQEAIKEVDQAEKESNSEQEKKITPDKSAEEQSKKEAEADKAAMEASKKKKKEQSTPVAPSSAVEEQSKQEEKQAEKTEQAEKEKKKIQAETAKTSDDVIKHNQKEAESVDKITQAEEEKQKIKNKDSRSEIESSFDKESKTVKESVDSETSQLEELRKKINEVTAAIDEKTTAFTQERLGVETNVALEIKELEKLENKITTVSNIIKENLHSNNLFNNDDVLDGKIIQLMNKYEISGENAFNDIKSSIISYGQTGENTIDSVTQSIASHINMINAGKDAWKDLLELMRQNNRVFVDPQTVGHLTDGDLNSKLKILGRKFNTTSGQELSSWIDEKFNHFSGNYIDPAQETGVIFDQLVDLVKRARTDTKHKKLTANEVLQQIDVDTLKNEINSIVSDSSFDSILNGISGISNELDGFIKKLNDIPYPSKSIETILQFCRDVQELFSTLNKFCTIDDNGFISSIKEIVDQKDALKDFASILKESKEKIKEVSTAVGTDKTQFSREEFANQYDSLKQTGEKYLTDNNFSQVLESSIKRSEKGIATFTAKVKDSNDVWNKFSATIDKDGKVMVSSVVAMSDKQGTALDRVVEEMGMLDSSQMAEIKGRVEQAISGLIKDAKVMVDKNGGINIFRTVTDSDGIVQNLANHFDDVKDIIGDTGNVASDFIDQLDNSPIVLNETTKELAENVALWDTMIDLARQYANVIGNVQNVTQMVRTDNGETKRSYRITGDTGNSLTVGANGRILNSTVGIDDSLTQSEESYKRQTAALQELSKLKLANYKATLSGNDAEIAKTEVLIQHQKELIQNEKDFRNNNAINLNNSTGNSEYVKQAKILASNLKAQKEATLASQVSSDWDAAIKENKKRQSENNKAMKASQEEAIKINKEITTASEESYKRQEKAMKNLTDAAIKNYKAQLENDKEKIASTQAVIDENKKLLKEESKLRNQEFTAKDGTKVSNLNTEKGNSKIEDLKRSLNKKIATSSSGIDQAHEEKETKRLIESELKAYKKLQEAKLQSARIEKDDKSTETQKQEAKDNIQQQNKIYQSLKQQVDAHQQIVDQLKLEEQRQANISQITQTYTSRINKIGKSNNELPANLVQAYEQLTKTEEQFQLLTQKNENGLITSKESKQLSELIVDRKALNDYIDKANEKIKTGTALTNEETEAQEKYNQKCLEAAKVVNDYQNSTKTQNALQMIADDTSTSKMMKRFEDVKKSKSNISGIKPIIEQTEQSLKNLNVEYVNGSKSEAQYQVETKKLIDKLSEIREIVDTTDPSKVRQSANNVIGSLGNVIDEGQLVKTKSGWQQIVKYVDLTDNKIKECTISINSASGALTTMTSKGTKQVGSLSKIFDFWKEKMKNVIGYISSFVGIFEVWNAFKQGVSVVSEFNAALIEMQKVSDESRNSLVKYQATTFDTAKAVGSTALQIQQSTADFMRLGQSLDEASQSAKDANILLNISEFDSIDDATESLIAMKAAYSDLSNLMIIDKLNNIGR